MSSSISAIADALDAVQCSWRVRLLADLAMERRDHALVAIETADEEVARRAVEFASARHDALIRVHDSAQRVGGGERLRHARLPHDERPMLRNVLERPG